MEIVISFLLLPQNMHENVEYGFLGLSFSAAERNFQNKIYAYIGELSRGSAQQKNLLTAVFMGKILPEVGAAKHRTSLLRENFVDMLNAARPSADELAAGKDRQNFRTNGKICNKDDFAAWIEANRAVRFDDPSAKRQRTAF